jgi:hypothetical protein
MSAPAVIAQKTAVIADLLKSCCRDERIPFKICQKITAWMEAQIKFLQERPAWNVGGVMGGLKRQFRGSLPQREEIKQIRKELFAIADIISGERGDEDQVSVKSAVTAAAAPAPESRPTQDGFVMMMVPNEMVSSVLMKGGSIVTVPTTAPTASAPTTAPTPTSTRPPKPDTRKMTPEERHARAARLQNPTTIFVPNATGPAMARITQSVIDQLIEQNIRIGNNERQLRYAIANKHRNSSVSVTFAGNPDSVVFQALIDQGVNVIIPPSESTAATAGAGGSPEWPSDPNEHGEITGEWVDVPIAPSDIPVGLNPPFDPSQDDEDDSIEDEDDEETPAFGMDFYGYPFTFGEKLLYKGKIWKVVGLGTRGITIRRKKTKIIIYGEAIERAQKVTTKNAEEGQ